MQRALSLGQMHGGCHSACCADARLVRKEQVERARARFFEASPPLGNVCLARSEPKEQGMDTVARVRFYKCKVCSLRFANQTLDRINEHRSSHGQGSYSVVKNPSEKKKKTVKNPNQPKVITDSFQTSIEWQRVRYRVLKLYGRRCMACGASDTELHVDHIKARSRYPKLALDINNLQVLCRACNLGKGVDDETDWRPQSRV